MKRKRQHKVSDIEACIQQLDAQIETRDRHIATATAELEAERQSGQAAHAERETWRLPALAEGNAEAKEKYAEASRKYLHHADRLSELAALIEQLTTDHTRLNRDRTIAVQTLALAENLEDAEQAIAAARQIDAGVATLIAGWRQLETIRLRQLQRASDASLPDAEVGKYHAWRVHRRVLAWGLEELRVIERPATHYGQDLTLEQVERAVQLGESPDATPTDPTVAIDAALAEADPSTITQH